MKQLKIAYLEPFYGGSHKLFVDGLIEQSCHHIRLYSLPHRFWKWRTRGASLEFLKAIPDPSVYDLVVASDMVNLAELQGLWPKRINTVLYLHENQLTYPLPNETARDANFIMTDLLAAQSATQLAFNSHAHRNAFFKAVQQFSQRIPDCKPGWILPGLKKKSTVLYPGLHLDDAAFVHRNSVPSNQIASPTLVWNHRWEYDKVPEDFLQVLQRLHTDQFSFKLILLGDRGSSPHPTLEQIESQFSDQVLFSGYASSKSEYLKWLQQGDIVISTAIQENFGISCVEAMHQGCFPLFPNRLSYPEIVAPAFHSVCLYHSLDDLVTKIKNYHPPTIEAKTQLRNWTQQFHWTPLINEFDRLFALTAKQPLSF